MFRFVYNLLFPVALLLVLPSYLAKLRRRGNYRHKFWQRFGIYDTEAQTRLAGGGRVWFHAVSVGEVAIALKLATTMRAQNPAFECVLTTTTTTGFAFANQPTREWIEVMYHPIDWWPIVHRAFGVIRPAKLVLVEAEVWPNLVAIARARRIPVALINARLSHRSERRFLRFRSLVAPTFRCLDLVCVQEPKDVERWAALGILRDRIQEVGSVKYDPAETMIDAETPRTVMRAFGIEDDRPVLFGGSTHLGEEDILGGVFREIRAQVPRCLLVLAPRHVERVPDVRTRLEAMSLNVALRSEGGREKATSIDCLLLDTTGELQGWYSIATVVFMGKSLSARGGQNPVEPLLAGKPVIFGPHMENFASLAEDLLVRGGALQVTDPPSLTARVTELLRDPARRAELVGNALPVLARHRGATQRTAELIETVRSQEHA